MKRFLFLLTVGVAAAATPPGPNVLFLIIDDHGPGLHSVLQPQSRIRTPNMERIAARGTWFTRAYVDAPACCPSRTAFLTGVHAARRACAPPLRASRAVARRR